MILADIPLPQGFWIPDLVLADAEEPGIKTRHQDRPFGADCWIACCYAMPHVDPGWRDKVFLTLSVLGDRTHVVGDAKSEQPDNVVSVGSLIVVQPLVAHWMFARDSWKETATKPWAGLQWEVPSLHAKRKAREIVAKLGGKWRYVEEIDKRYRGWVPQAKEQA